MPPSPRLTHWSTKLGSTDFEIGSIDRHRRFIERVVTSEAVWGLKSNEGWCVAHYSEQEKRSVMPFWSDRGYAQQCARNEWADYQATAIPLDMFLDEWL